MTSKSENVANITTPKQNREHRPQRPIKSDRSGTRGKKRTPCEERKRYEIAAKGNLGKPKNVLPGRNRTPRKREDPERRNKRNRRGGGRTGESVNRHRRMLCGRRAESKEHMKAASERKDTPTTGRTHRKKACAIGGPTSQS